MTRRQPKPTLSPPAQSAPGQSQALFWLGERPLVHRPESGRGGQTGPVGTTTCPLPGDHEEAALVAAIIDTTQRGDNYYVLKHMNCTAN